VHDVVPQNGKRGYCARGCPSSALLIEATKQLNRRLSLFSALLTKVIY
jgi:hypothetical protein